MCLALAIYGLVNIKLSFGGKKRLSIIKIGKGNKKQMLLGLTCKSNQFNLRREEFNTIISIIWCSLFTSGYHLNIISWCFSK